MCVAGLVLKVVYLLVVFSVLILIPNLILFLVRTLHPLHPPPLPHHPSVCVPRAALKMKMFAQFSAQLHFHYAARRGSVT